MSDQIAGQVDIFAELGEAAPVPPFTVFTCVWATGQRCGWCHGKGYDGGGACRNPEDDKESFFYDYCRPCREKHGYPKVTREGFPVVIDRTQKPRPGDAPDLSSEVAA
jgi:hypothetical protein